MSPKLAPPQRASEILVRVVKREHLPSHMPKAMRYSLLRAGVDARAVNRIRIYNRREPGEKMDVCRRFTRMLERDGRLGPAEQ